MDKPYGYKESDLIALAKFVKDGNADGKTRSRVFREYAEVSGKAEGSVRNLYYALAEYAAKNAEFAQKYLGGKPFTVKRAENFTQDEERKIISEIEDYKKKGVSVRQAALKMADGDAKTALRIQNKYRAFARLKAESDFSAERFYVSDEFTVQRLKKEINRLADNIALELKKENAALKRRIAVLAGENERLKKNAYKERGGAAEYFGRIALSGGTNSLNR